MYSSWNSYLSNAAVSEGGTGKSSVMCVFHTLIEFLVGMKFSVGIQTEELCLSVIHEKSGNYEDLLPC